MVARIILFSCLMAAAAAVTVSPEGPQVPLLASPSTASHVEYSVPAHYAYEYSVNNHHNGDVKSHRESRDGDLIKGSYSLLQPDGTQRIVEYTVDKKSGFKAKVRYEGKPIAAPAKASFPAPVAEVVYASSQAPDAKEASSNSNVSFRSRAVSYRH